MFPFRIGFGYDVHQLIEGRPLIIGGVKIDHYKGALGHSDADVLLHAVCDALLGATGLRDIGYYFPDTSDEYKGIESRLLLVKTIAMVSEQGWKIGNIDCTIALQKPKISVHIEEMRRNIAAVAGLDSGMVSIKATTTENLGFTGREEGIQAWAVALIYQ
ncbi:MAG: 2-C-methyl-D-erythritol 2,4-cyclodiphosphate synthase [Bacteroidales bacterium]|nr:2-C-methyl-D-erythritol 2,4-cyclodiphosphate synthase [Bacteroidales bacterium]MBK9359062.1 2-C-methyl-D-erythritol 2,4-cyclodiphosphate synthase [Bacteroidales bacterium]